MRPLSASALSVCTLQRVSTWQAGGPWDPGNPENRERTRRLQREVRVQLLRWDPIGVAHAAEAQDEYDAYISPLMHMLHRGDSVDAITAWLVNLVEDHIGLNCEPKDAAWRRTGNLHPLERQALHERQLHGLKPHSRLSRQEFNHRIRELVDSTVNFETNQVLCGICQVSIGDPRWPVDEAQRKI